MSDIESIVADAAGADDDLLARELDETARSTPGVREVYSARPVVARAVERLRGTDGALSLVRLGVDGGREVTVSIGVRCSADSGAVAAAVADRIRTRLGGLDGDTVRVRVSRLVADA
jgi:hypothetical protein